MSSKNNKEFSSVSPGYDVEAGAQPEQGRPPKRRSSKHRHDSDVGRARTYSSGSTRGAFYPHGEVPPIAETGEATHEMKKNRLKKKHSKRNNQTKQNTQIPAPMPDQVAPGVPPGMAPYQYGPPPSNMNMGTGSDLGDVASMAIAGLGDELSMEELVGGASPPRKSRRGPQTNGTMAPPPSNYNRRMKQSPPSSSSHLETIPDTSDRYNTLTPEPGRRMDNNPELQQFNMYGGLHRKGSDKRESVDSLRISDATLDGDANNFMRGMQRDNSMYLSGNADEYGTLQDQLPQDFTYPDRSSLTGVNFLDKRSSSSPYQTQPNRRAIESANNNFPHPRSTPSRARPPMKGQQLSALSEVPTQQNEIANFSAMLHADYGSGHDSGGRSSPQIVDEKKLLSNQGPPSRAPPPFYPARPPPYPASKPVPYAGTSTEDEDSEESLEEEIERQQSRFLDYLDPTHWLTRDVKFDHDIPYFDDSAGWNLAGFIRYLLYNPISPEFTSLQQFSWAVILGILMGFFTAYWKEIIEKSIDVMWKDIPEHLLEWGFFTELDGSFPLYHYMWICPAFWGAVLSYVFVILPTPIPGQNEWIQNVHTMGVQSHETFFLLFILSTLGMASGLSLGPELPLVLTAGMIGSWLGIQCKQSVLQARVMNITAASAAVGGFFGFPMAGALFVLEIPHRMGLQYFEALSPATIASIVAVLCNRLVTGSDVTGYYKYPFLTTTLPSEIFTSAIVFGLFGAALGTFYARIVLFLKGLVHDFFHAPHDEHDGDGGRNGEAAATPEESTPLVAKELSGEATKKQPPPGPPLHERIMRSLRKYVCCIIPHEPSRAAAAGAVSGALVGIICIFIPHVLFWGEAQLQTLIDKGRTPLPVFGQKGNTTEALTHMAYCMIDPDDAAAGRAGFSIGCSLVITVAKVIVTGLSLGTGIIGGHFWGPLFAGCAASHFLTDAVNLFHEKFGFGQQLAAYPCVTILCTMGSTHVVTFRAHMAIMLILTLTISAFDPQEGDDNKTDKSVAGDYSAVFPLLVISVFVSLMVSRQTVFYKAQRSRGDIMALPEVLCEPGKEGMPMVIDYVVPKDELENEGSDHTSDDGGYQSDRDVASPQRAAERRSPASDVITQDAIEKNFNAMNAPPASPTPPLPRPDPSRTDKSRGASRERADSQDSKPRSRGVSPLPPRPQDKKTTISGNLPPAGPPSRTDGDGANSPSLGELSSSRLDELLAKPLDYERPQKGRHRRIKSAPNVDFRAKQRFSKARTNSSFNNGENDDSASNLGGSDTGSAGRHKRSDSTGSHNSGPVMQVKSFGHLVAEQPSLMDQARLRSATSVILESRHIRNPSMPSLFPRSRGHSRQNSSSSVGPGTTSSIPMGPPVSVTVAAADRNAVPPAEVERAFTSAANRQLHGRNMSADGSNRGYPIPPEDARTG